MPEDIEASSVAKAFLKSAASTGNAVRVTAWRGDGAGDCAAVPVAVAGHHDEALVKARESVRASIEKGTALLESLTMATGDDAESGATAWRYVVPFALGEITGAAGVDFLGDRPDLESLNRISAAYRLPLAASLALEIARDESDAARTLIETARELARLLDPDAVVRASLAKALDLTGGQSGSIMLYDESGVDLRIAAAVGLPSDVVESTAVRPGNGIAGWVAISGQPLVVEDLPGRDTPARSRGTRSAVSVPIADAEGVLGVLNVGSSDHPSRFTATELETLEALAHQTAVALRNARTVASASDLYFDTLRALALAIETRDPYAHGGTDRIMRYTSLLAGEMGLPAHETRALEIAAMLHDIGMPSGCEEALSADRPLSTVEHGLITMHPVIAAEILDQAPALREVAPIVYHHHERYDGTGYVEGLSGDGIPLGSRILCVADAFVAMTSDRPYREAFTDDEAVKELLKGSGTQFDPEVVDAFLAIHSSRQDRVPGSSA
jgi:putative methionine-R-sulfoxide reductase with GAF domain